MVLSYTVRLAVVNDLAACCLSEEENIEAIYCSRPIGVLDVSAATFLGYPQVCDPLDQGCANLSYCSVKQQYHKLH